MVSHLDYVVENHGGSAEPGAPESVHGSCSRDICSIRGPAFHGAVLIVLAIGAFAGWRCVLSSACNPHRHFVDVVLRSEQLRAPNLLALCRFSSYGHTQHWVIAGLLGAARGGDSTAERLPILFTAASELTPDVACRCAALTCCHDRGSVTQPSAERVLPPARDVAGLGTRCVATAAVPACRHCVSKNSSELDNKLLPSVDGCVTQQRSDSIMQALQVLVLHR